MADGQETITLEDLDPALFHADIIIRKPLPPNPPQELLSAVLSYALEYLRWLAHYYHRPYPFEDDIFPTRETLAEHIENIKKEADAALQKIVEIASINLLKTHNEVLENYANPPVGWRVPKKPQEPKPH